MMKLLRENGGENILARHTTASSFTSTFSSSFFAQTTMTTTPSSRLLIPTPSLDLLSSRSVIDDFYNDVGSILDLHTCASSKDFMMDDETMESAPLEAFSTKFPEPTRSSHWKRDTNVEKVPVKVASAKVKPPQRKRVRHHIPSEVAAKRRRTIAPVAPKSSAPRCTSNEESLPKDDNTEELDHWQQQFLKFLTYPSDHILQATGQRVPFKDTIIWGRQKVLWTAALSNEHSSNKSGPETVASSSWSNKNESKAERVVLSSPCGGNHLSHQLVVKAAAAAAASAPAYPTHTMDFIRRTEDQALWFHGGSHVNQNLGQWLQQERQSYQSSLRHKSPLYYHRTAKVPPRKKQALNGPRRSQDAFLSKQENEVIYNHLQKSFRFQLMQLCGIDLQNILPEETMFQGPRRHSKYKK